MSLIDIHIGIFILIYDAKVRTFFQKDEGISKKIEIF